MSFSSFIRWGSLAGIVGGVLWAVTPLREPLLGGELPGHPVFRPYNFALVVIAVLLALGLLALHTRYKGSYGRLGMAGFVITFLGYVLLFFGSIPAVFLSPEGFTDLIMGGQDLGFLGALVAGVGAILLGIALWRLRAASRLGALLLIIALPAGMVGVVLLSTVGLVSSAGLPLTFLYGAAWVVLGIQLLSQSSVAAEQPLRVS